MADGRNEVLSLLLSRELGRPVPAAELWKGRTSGDPLVRPADLDMDGPWSRASTLGLLDDWVVAGLLDRRHFASAVPTAAVPTCPMWGRSSGRSRCSCVRTSIPPEWSAGCSRPWLSSGCSPDGWRWTPVRTCAQRYLFTALRAAREAAATLTLSS